MTQSYHQLKTVRGLDSGPLCPFAQPYIARLRGQGYCPKTIRTRLYHIARLNRWLMHGHRRLRDLDERMVARFLMRQRLRRKGCCSALGALHPLLEILLQEGVTPPVQASPLTPTQRLREEYRQHLLRERGFAPGTIVNFTRQVDRFLAWRLGSRRGDLAKLRADDVVEFLQHLAGGPHPAQAQPAAIALRSFLRYLHYCGRVPRDLSSTVPPVAHWRQSELPKYLPTASIRAVLESCEQSSVVGRRNYAILLLLARLGLRAGEIISLRLEDIDWEQAHLLIRSRKGPGLARLPLPADVGRAIARYVREGRPCGPCRNLFVRAEAPHAPFSGSGAISALARRALQKAGVVSPHTGAHVFRHSLATTLLEQGATLDEIGQVLRHQNPDSTALYAKVQLAALRPLALPWPGGAR